MILFFGFRFKIKVSIKSVLGSLIFSLLQCNLWQLFGKCSDRDGKIWKNVEKCEKCGKMWKNVLETRFYYTTYIYIYISNACMIIHFGFRLIRVDHPMLPRITMLAYYLSSADQIVRKILYY